MFGSSTFLVLEVQVLNWLEKASHNTFKSFFLNFLKLIILIFYICTNYALL